MVGLAVPAALDAGLLVGDSASSAATMLPSETSAVPVTECGAMGLSGDGERLWVSGMGCVWV